MPPGLPKIQRQTLKCTCEFSIPYYCKVTLHEIRVLEINKKFSGTRLSNKED